MRDNDRFYSPLGLESEGTAVDFQVGVNDYLYGTRFMSYLALKYGPEKFVEWQSRRKGSKAFYAAQFRHVFGRRLDDVWNDWIAFEHEYQKANLARLAQYPLTQTVKLSPRGLGSMSRGFVDAKTNSLIAAFRYPGTIGFIGLIAPHAARALVGDDHRLSLPLAGVTGATLLITASVVSKLISPAGALPVGIVTALAGVPMLVFIILGTSRRYPS